MKKLFALVMVAPLLCACNGGTSQAGSDDQSSSETPIPEVDPLFDIEHGFISYGMFPQTVVNDADLITALSALEAPEENGWYLYNDEYYAKLEDAHPNGDTVPFGNGDIVVRGATYWFKVETIRWKVLKDDQYLNSYFTVSEQILDRIAYHSSKDERTIDGETVYANNYKHSDIRAYLNGDFYRNSFAKGKKYLAVTSVDNLIDNDYGCPNTEDKIYLLSRYELQRDPFPSSNSGDLSKRYATVTDYAKARGAALYYAGSSATNSGMYWTRSPSASGNGKEVMGVNSMGQITSISDLTDATNGNGLRPAVQIKKSA